MAREQIVNDAFTFLDIAIDDVATAMFVMDVSQFPSDGNFIVAVDSEIIQVTAVTGSIFTCVRGREDTTAAAHSNGAVVSHILSSGSLLQHVQNDVPLFADTDVPPSNHLRAQVYQVANTFGNFTGVYRWWSGTLANGFIYAVPYSHLSVLKIDPSNDSVSTFGSLTGANKWTGSILAPNGMIYGIPYSSATVLKIDPSDDSLSEFGSLSGALKWQGGVLAPNGMIYGIPRNATTVLKIDPSDDSISELGSLSSDQNKWVGGVVTPGGIIYGIPLNSGTILKVDTNDDTVSTFAGPSGSWKWEGGVLAPNGMIYGIPLHKTQVLKIDPSDDSWSEFGSLSGLSKWQGGVLASNGCIYGMPANSTSILKIDPRDDSLTTFGSLTGTLKWNNGVLAPNGAVYGMPSNSEEILKIVDVDGAVLTASDFTPINQGDSTLTDYASGGLRLTVPKNSSLNVRLYKKSAPTPPYKLTVQVPRWLLAWNGTTQAGNVGIGFRGSSSGKFYTIQYAGTGVVSGAWWNSPTSWAGGPSAFRLRVGDSVWFQIEDEGGAGDLIFRYGIDGVHWDQLYRDDRDTFITGGPDEIHLYIITWNVAVNTQRAIFSTWIEE